MIFTHSNILTRENFCSSLSDNYISRYYSFTTVFFYTKSSTGTISSVSRLSTCFFCCHNLPNYFFSSLTAVSAFFSVTTFFSASDSTLPSFEKILLILIIEYSCLCPFFLLEFCLLLFLNIKTVLFFPFLINSASTLAPETVGAPTSITLSSPYASISLNSIFVSGLESVSFSIFRISPDLTLYCLPPVCITAYDIVFVVKFC